MIVCRHERQYLSTHLYGCQHDSQRPRCHVWSRLQNLLDCRDRHDSLVMRSTYYHRGSRIPWHRVINAQGKVSLRVDGEGSDNRQARSLKREKVKFNQQGVVTGFESLSDGNRDVKT